jgi:hypothetical protein
MKLLVAIFALGSIAFFATPGMADTLTGASATGDCSGYSLTVNAIDLTPGTMYEIDYTLTLNCADSTLTVPGSITFTATGTTATETATGTWPGTPPPLPIDCRVTDGSATLTSSGSTVPITINGQSEAQLSCSGTPPGAKSFGIGPSSMEGDLHISPGDWISGGYNFKFVDRSHAATAYKVEATVTVPVSCPDGTSQNIVIPLGQPGVLDGGGVMSFTYSIPAGDTQNHATNNQNSILVWEGAVQAPATLCGGQTGRNQVGAVFNATVLQEPHVGLVDWQFHYRDPAAKGKGNVDCTDASNPLRSHADVCGASWSQTLRDP